MVVVYADSDKRCCQMFCMYSVLCCLLYGVDRLFVIVSLCSWRRKRDRRNVGVKRKGNNDDGLPTFFAAIVGGGAATPNEDPARPRTAGAGPL